jgi:hypothetical protein
VRRAARLLLVASAALGLGGCFVLFKVPGMVDEMSDLSVAELDAGAGVWGRTWQGRTESEVRTSFGPPTTATDADGVRTLWYMGRRDGAWGVVFREGRLLAAFRTTPRELDDLLARKPPY